MGDKNGSPVYYVSSVVEWLLLLSDVAIVILFVADGVKKAFKATFGKP